MSQNNSTFVRISRQDGDSIAMELLDSANQVAMYLDRNSEQLPIAARRALNDEVTRLRDLARKVSAPPTDKQSAELADKLFDELRLLIVFCDKITGLVSLTTGELMVWTPEGLGAHCRIPRCEISPDEVEKRLGENRPWSAIINHLQEHYDWQRKCLPDFILEPADA